MKKISSLILVACILILSLGLTACGDKKTDVPFDMSAQEAYNAAIEKINGSDSGTFTSNITVSIFGVETNNHDTVQKYNGNSLYTKENIDIEQETWLVNNVLYSKAFSGMTKQEKELSPEEAQKILDTKTSAERLGLGNIPDSWLEKADFYDSGDGLYYLKFSFNSDERIEYFPNSYADTDYINVISMNVKLYFDESGSIVKTVVAMTTFNIPFIAKANYTTELSDFGNTTVEAPW